MSIHEGRVRDALRSVRYPGFTRDIVALGLVKDVRVHEGRVEIRLDPGPGSAPSIARDLESSARRAIEALEGVTEVVVAVASASASPGLRMAGSPRPSAAAGGSIDPGFLPEVRSVVAVASGKGGVGKSTVAVNLAVALAADGARTGLLDADVFGPSIPLMMGLRDRPRATPDGRLLPFEKHGVRLMSLGSLVDPSTAVVWRGPMVMKAIDELLGRVAWGSLDILVVDMPPGTGDVQLSISQRVQLAGAVIVTTPQDVALADAIKGVDMFRKVDVPVLGIVENMSYFVCSHCGERTDVFGHGGGRREAERLGVAFLGEVPLDPAIRDAGDRGRPFVTLDPEDARASAFRSIAAAVRSGLPGQDDAAEPGGGVFDRFRRKFMD